MNVGALHNYPYINYCNYKTKALTLNGSMSASLVWNSKRSLKCAINNKQEVIPSNTILLLHKGSQFSCESNQLSHVKVIRFNAEIFTSSLVFFCGFINESIKKNNKNCTFLFFPNKQTPTIKRMFNTIEQLLQESKPINIELLKKAICYVLHDALFEKFEKESTYINRFGELLKTQYAIHHNVSDYAKQLNIEPKNLLRLFQKKGLINPSQTIKQKLLFESKKLLIYTDRSMRDICFEMGFCDPAYFSRFFKKNTGITTQNFKRKFIQKVEVSEMEKSTML